MNKKDFFDALDIRHEGLVCNVDNWRSVEKNGRSYDVYYSMEIDSYLINCQDKWTNGSGMVKYEDNYYTIERKDGEFDFDRMLYVIDMWMKHGVLVPRFDHIVIDDLGDDYEEED